MTRDHLSDDQCADLAELAAMLKSAKNEMERWEIRRTMAEIIDPSLIGELRWVNPRRRRRRKR